MAVSKPYDSLAAKSSKLITKQYSTSFYIATLLLDKSIRNDIYAIYGLVRIADELVDTLRPKDLSKQLNLLETQTTQAIKSHVSTNMIVHNFALTANKFSIPQELTAAFFNSMRKDIRQKRHSQSKLNEYIFGSAEAVGLMCLCVFVNSKNKQYSELRIGAKALGSAFQKVNFLRDISSDYNNLGRIYFPQIKNFKTFSDLQKQQIVKEIETEFELAKQSIVKLPRSSRYAVLLSWYYFRRLNHIINNTPAVVLKKKRIKVSNSYKLFLFLFIRAQKLFQL